MSYFYLKNPAKKSKMWNLHSNTFDLNVYSYLNGDSDFKGFYESNAITLYYTIM